MISKKMPSVFTILFFSLCTAISVAAGEPDLNELLTAHATVPQSRTTTPAELCASYNDFNNLIRDGQISKDAARTELVVRLAAIRSKFYQHGGSDYLPTQWFFPVAGYDSNAIAKGGSHGFVASGYDFFSGNRHGGHPAYDVFIRDRNQDSRDDRNGKTVSVLSMTGGIVVALEKEWQNGSKLRGGKYIWIYDPASNLLVYYAHNEEIFVELGTIVAPGDIIATIGRSGLNAAKKRSPTHLHFSVLSLKSHRPLPIPVYRELQRAKGV